MNHYTEVFVLFVKGNIEVLSVNSECFSEIIESWMECLSYMFILILCNTVSVTGINK